MCLVYTWEIKLYSSNRPGFTVLEVPNVPTGEYVITPTTYGDNQEGPFFLTASSDNVFNFETVHS